MIHQKQSSLLDSGTFPLAPLHHHRGCVKILLLLSDNNDLCKRFKFTDELPEHYLDIVLVLDSSQVRTTGIRSFLKTWVKYNSSSGSPLPCCTWKLGTIGRSKLNNSGVNSRTLALALSTPAISPAIETYDYTLEQLTTKAKLFMYLVTLLVRVTSITVWEVDVAVGFSHHSPYRVPTLAYNVGMIRIAHIHLHSNSAVGRCIQNLGNEQFRSFNTFFMKFCLMFLKQFSLQNLC